jgi:hypothetical protein
MSAATRMPAAGRMSATTGMPATRMRRTPAGRSAMTVIMPVMPPAIIPKKINVRFRCHHDPVSVSVSVITHHAHASRHRCRDQAYAQAYLDPMGKIARFAAVAVPPVGKIKKQVAGFRSLAQFYFHTAIYSVTPISQWGIIRSGWEGGNALWPPKCAGHGLKTAGSTMSLKL